MTRRRIIGIHGLNNKPPAAVLAVWWRAALEEGFARNGGATPLPFDFELVHWADVMHSKPLVEDPEPYVAASGSGPLPNHAGSWSDTARELAQGAVDKLTAVPSVDRITDELISRKVPDLDRYYSNAGVRRELRGRFATALDRAQRDRRATMVIAHSMGSIIAFDVLAAMTRRTGGVTIRHFITIGSPLGLHEVKQQARDEGLASHVPEVVEHWTNLADRRDRVAFDSRLATDYGANAAGVKIIDRLVVNGYVGPSGRANPHKIYGYLRAPEMTSAVLAFLASN